MYILHTLYVQYTHTKHAIMHIDSLGNRRTVVYNKRQVVKEICYRWKQYL